MNFTVLRELKRDVFGRVELVRLDREGPDTLAPAPLAIRRVACGSRLPGSSLLARILLGREARALVRLHGLAGVPRTLQGTRSELIRSYQAGVPLSETDELALDFFERLAELVGEVHALGVCHNDLHKEQNVIVGVDGRPCLVDFQLASVHDRDSRARRVRRREDLRHVEKHRRRYLRDGRGPEGVAFDRRALPPMVRSPGARFWRRVIKPIYVFVTRSLLRTRDGEIRRRSDGAWPRWTEALGRAGGEERPRQMPTSADRGRVSDGSGS